MSRGGRTKDRSTGPERKCIATGDARPKTGLIRFVVAPDGRIAPDLAEKLPGRGIWVSADRAAIDRAVTKGLFARAARQKVEAPADLADRVEAQLARRVVELISLARKSGEAVAGYEKVKAFLDTDAAQVLIQASDGSARGKSKLSTPYRGRFIGWLTAAELGRAFGRTTAVHAALGAGGLAQRVVEEAARLQGLRVSDGGTTRRKGSRTR
ncbi:RNA-binding protein [Roseovarius salinarum]|uniref:RNA-binding protein n=1 Tax=Roseovarius salinarum TaxID=1981892 RepID=UPI000C342CA2|nr:RNA-binding protein [Roseovarius salinarum]